MQATIRPVESADSEGITAIYRPIVEETTISFEEVAPDAAEMGRRIAEVTRRYPWLVAERDGVLAGYAYASRHRERAAYRYSVDVSVYVARAARNAGVASALYAALLGRLSADGFHRAFAGIALPNDASISLHRHFGFELVGTYSEAGWKFGRWLDVAWFQKAL